MKKKEVVQELRGIHETLDGITTKTIPLISDIDDAILRIGLVIDALRKKWNLP